MLFFGVWFALAGWETWGDENSRVLLGQAARTAATAAGVGAVIGLVAVMLRRCRLAAMITLALAAIPTTAALTFLCQGVGLSEAVIFSLAMSFVFGLVTVPLGIAAGVSLTYWVRPLQRDQAA